MPVVIVEIYNKTSISFYAENFVPENHWKPTLKYSTDIQFSISKLKK